MELPVTTGHSVFSWFCSSLRVCVDNLVVDEPGGPVGGDSDGGVAVADAHILAFEAAGEVWLIGWI